MGDEFEAAAVITNLKNAIANYVRHRTTCPAANDTQKLRRWVLQWQKHQETFSQWNNEALSLKLKIRSDPRVYECDKELWDFEEALGIPHTGCADPYRQTLPKVTITLPDPLPDTVENMVPKGTSNGTHKKHQNQKKTTKSFETPCHRCRDKGIGCQKRPGNVLACVHCNKLRKKCSHVHDGHSKPSAPSRSKTRKPVRFSTVDISSNSSTSDVARDSIVPETDDEVEDENNPSPSGDLVGEQGAEAEGRSLEEQPVVGAPASHTEPSNALAYPLQMMQAPTTLTSATSLHYPPSTLSAICGNPSSMGRLSSDEEPSMSPVQYDNDVGSRASSINATPRANTTNMEDVVITLIEENRRMQFSMEQQRVVLESLLGQLRQLR
ncbi:hypothetical protein FISHEDRAFT_71710 [Fistulina hepatica ATCC 64428]|uniref:Uncharacterized protein n=1 Tax=Fistulina hepatica ATCC 64428 TaxID=1128425 RepID=A0A0D7AH86_9AGAR|nr:hypothetical protein FISHEDRAFT_71710 [Fistulina hepatica ATCC 64428]